MECPNSHCFACIACHCSALRVYPSEVAVWPTIAKIIVRYGWLCYDFTWVHSQTEQERAVQAK